MILSMSTVVPVAGGLVPFWLDRVTLPLLWGFCGRFTPDAAADLRQHVRWAHHLLSFAGSAMSSLVWVSACWPPASAPVADQHPGGTRLGTGARAPGYFAPALPVRLRPDPQQHQPGPDALYRSGPASHPERLWCSLAVAAESIPGPGLPASRCSNGRKAEAPAKLIEKGAAW